MSTAVVDVRSITFSQDTMKPEFQDGDSVQQLIEDLTSGRVSIDDLPPIRVVQMEDSTFVSLDNRRLYALKEALKYKRQQNIEVQMVAKKECTDELNRKLTTCCNGKGIRVKDGKPNWTIRTGPRDGEYVFDKDQCQVYTSNLNRKQIAEIMEKDPSMLKGFAKRGLLSVEDAEQEQENPGHLIEKIKAEISAGFRVNKGGRPVDPKTSKYISDKEALKLGYGPAVAKAEAEQKRKQAEAERQRQCQQDEVDQKWQHAEAEQRRQAERQRQQKAEQHQRAEEEQRRKQVEDQRQQKVEQQHRQAEEERRRQQVEEQRRRQQVEDQQQRQEQQRRQAEEERRRQQVEDERRYQQAEAERQRQQSEQRRHYAEMEQQQRYHTSSGSANGRELHTGARGGTYYMNSNGNKTYV